MRIQFGLITDKTYIYTGIDRGQISGKFTTGEDTYELKDTKYIAKPPKDGELQDSIDIQLSGDKDYQPVGASLDLSSGGNVTIKQKIPNQDWPKLFLLDNEGCSKDDEPVPDDLQELARDAYALLEWARAEHNQRGENIKRFL